MSQSCVKECKTIEAGMKKRDKAAKEKEQISESALHTSHASQKHS